MNLTSNINNFYFNKNVLITGGTGLIGIQLAKKLKSLGANLTIVSLDNPKILKDFTIIKKDLRYFDNCLEVCEGQEIIFHLAGVKGSPKMNIEQPASFMVPTLMFSINMMEAAIRKKVSNYLLTSTIGVYAQDKIFKENNVWSTFPSPNDKFPGWAKRICELQAEAYKIQYEWENISIVRPANVYGPFDNFNPENAMVIPSLIYKALNSEKRFEVWGDGSAIRDFIYSEDVADAMIKIVENGIKGPINIGSGKGVSIKELVKIICQNHHNPDIEVVWSSNELKGDDIKLMDVSLAESYKIFPKININEGISKTMNWYKNFGNEFKNSRYNPFTENFYD